MESFVGVSKNSLQGSDLSDASLSLTKATDEAVALGRKKKEYHSYLRTLAASIWAVIARGWKLWDVFSIGVPNRARSLVRDPDTD